MCGAPQGSNRGPFPVSLDNFRANAWAKRCGNHSAIYWVTVNSRFKTGQRKHRLAENTRSPAIIVVAGGSTKFLCPSAQTPWKLWNFWPWEQRVCAFNDAIVLRWSRVREEGRFPAEQLSSRTNWEFWVCMRGIGKTFQICARCCSVVAKRRPPTRFEPWALAVACARHELGSHSGFSCFFNLFSRFSAAWGV